MNVNNVLAANLRFFMEERGLTQEALSAQSGVAQTTLSLYINPENRRAGKSGRIPSPTLAGVELLADALGVDLWELLRPLTLAQRDLYRGLEKAFAEAITKTIKASEAPATVENAGMTALVQRVQAAADTKTAISRARKTAKADGSTPKAKKRPAPRVPARHPPRS